MLSNGFISQLSNYKKLQLGSTEKLFLSIICIEPASAYRIAGRLKNGFIDTPVGIVTADIKPMAYKNVHKRVIRLYSLGLIEKIEGNFTRNAKNYKLTTKGLLEQLLDANPLLPDIFDVYRSNPVIETLIYQYFEFETIASFEELPLVYLRNYLRRCCEAVLSRLDVHRYETNFIERSGVSNFELKLKQHDSHLPGSIDKTIRQEAKNFVFEIVIISKDEDPYVSDKNYRNIFPRQALVKDKRFIGLLQEIKNDFKNGCRNYL